MILIMTLQLQLTCTNKSLNPLEVPKNATKTSIMFGLIKRLARTRSKKSNTVLHACRIPACRIITPLTSYY